MHSPIALLLAALCAGSLFLAAFLFCTDVMRANRSANKWLGLFFLSLCLLFVERLLQSRAGPQSILIYISEWSRWAMFPCLYMAVHAFVRPQKHVPLIFLHFLPIVAFACLSLAGSHLLPAGFGVLVLYFFFAQGIVYGILNLQLLNLHKRNIRKLLADNGSDLNWLRNFVYAPWVIAIMWLIFKNLPEMDNFGYLLCLALSLYFVSAALRQRAVYPPEIIDVAVLVNEPKSPLASQRLTQQQIDLLKERVTAIVDQKKPHLDPSLNLQTLANEVGINTHELSLVLNQGFGVNFYAYVNGLRVEEAVKLLTSGDYGRGDMEAIAYRSGFNSRTTFYAALKKLKNVTPTSLLK